MQTEKDELKNPYCENCFEEELQEYVIDSLGSIFCNETCCKESQEWRELDVSSLTKVKVRA